LYSISLNDSSYAYVLNSTVNYFGIELFGRTNLGDGALDFKVYETKGIQLIDYSKQIKELNLDERLIKRKTEDIFIECGFNSKEPLRDQNPNPKPDRAELDELVFNIIGLNKDEKKEVYWSLCELVQNRIIKSKNK